MAGGSLFGLSHGVAAAKDSAPAADGAASLTEVVITAPREEVRARLKQKDALTIVNVQSAETIAKYPDYNAAEALGRVPGVSLSTDTGEGRFVNIRGIDANLNGATYGGVVLLNTFAAGTAASGSGRAVEFDTIPTGAIDGLVVYKTLSPDREAEGLGGQIELTPRSAKQLSKPFLETDTGIGYEPLHHHGGPYTGAIAAGTRFGFANGKLVVAGDGTPVSGGSGWISNPTPFSIVITASTKQDQRAIDDIEPSYANDGATAVDNVYGEVDFRRYDYHRRRFGSGIAFDFEPNENHSYYLRADQAGYTEAVQKNHLYVVFDGNPTPLAGSANTVVDTFQPRVFQDNSSETHRNTIYTAGGEDKFGDLVIDYRAAFSEATYVEDYYKEALWYGPKGLYGTYDQSNPDHLVFNFYNDAGLTSKWDSTNASQYANPRLRQYFENDKDRETSYALNAKYPISWLGDNGQVKFGASARLRTKIVADFGVQIRPTADLSTYVASVGAPYDYYNGWYPTAPFPARHVADSLFNQPLTPSTGRDFNDKEDVYAAYGMYTFDIGKWGILAGARVEQTKETYGNYLTTTDASGNSTTTFVTNPKTYTNVFPTLQGKYEIDDSTQLRITYSTGIARPGFTQAGGDAGVDFTTSPRPQATKGNPNLKPTTGNNFEVDFEHYMPYGGILQIGLFDKEFSNYIFRHARINVMDPIFQGQAGDIITYSNEKAYARGVEMAYHQKFSTLPGIWSGLGVDANLTLVDSKFLEYEAAVSGTGQNEYGTLPGTSKVTWNLAGFYEANGLALRLSVESVSSSLFGLNGDKSLDTIQANKTNMDFTSSYQLNRNWNLYFSAKNLLNTPLRYNEGSAFRVIQREIYGQTYELGLRSKF
jgi:TonB-dependent receptor